MKLYIDTEFNSYRGELISMALVDEVADLHRGMALGALRRCRHGHGWEPGSGR